MELICHQLRKVYPDGTEALQSIDLQTGSGLLGLLGPNGAGKTTLMEILTLLLEPTSGTVSFGGIDYRKQMRQLRPLIGYLPQFFGYFPELTAREFLHYLSTLRGISGQDADQQVKELLFAVRLQDVANRRLKTYSGGMLRRVGIAQALLGDPKLIVVDEPTAGLDPEERVNFRNLLFELSEGRTVLLSTHIVKDIEDTCTNMALMLNGQIQFHGNTTDFIRSAQEDTWEFWGVPQDMERYSGKTNLVSIREEDRGVCFRIIAPEPPVESAQRVQPNLEDAYVRYLETQKPAAQPSKGQPMTPMEALEKKPNRFRRVLQGFVGFFTGIPGALYALGILIWQFLKWSRLESAYWFRLFLYTSRNFLRLEALLTVVGAVLFFGYVITNDLAQSGEALIYYSYIYFSVVMVLLAMNVLPREREIGTLEILWSQPLRRSSMVVVQLLTLSVWMLVLNLIWLGFIQYFTAYPEGKWILLLLVWTTTVSVGALTLLISTFCRHSIATGLVMMLLLGLHFYWLTSLGPVQFFYIPLDLVGLIDPAQAAPRGFGGRGGSSNSGWFDLMFNRITLIVTVGFILDFLFRRLRRTAEWFTQEIKRKRRNPVNEEPTNHTEEKQSNIRGMGAAAFAVKYPVTVSMLFIGVVMLGWISLGKLPTNLFPDLRAPRITVQAEVPGLAPQEVERVVVEELEGRVGQIRGVEKVSSVSRSDFGIVVVDFIWGTDMDFAMLDVKKNVQGVNIQELVEAPSTTRYDPNALPILTLGLTGDRSLEELYYLADRTVGPALERITGVAFAEITGGHIPEVHCILKPELLHFYGLTINQVASALDQANVSASGGTVDEGNQRYMIRSIGEIKKPEELPRTVVGYSENAPIYLEDIGEVKVSYEELTNMVHMNQKAGVGISLYKESGANTVEVVSEVRKFLNKELKEPSFFAKLMGGGSNQNQSGGNFGGGNGSGRGGGRGGFGGGQPKFDLIPEDTKIDIAYDQAMFINRSISEVKSTAIQGVILAGLVLLVFLRNFRTTIIVALAIPVSILATFNLMYFMDLSLNIMTLGGLALGAGMLVDNAIVVIENIFRRKQLGDNSTDAAMRGAGEVGSAIAASTLTTVVVFVPIAYMGGVTAQLFKEQALTVVFSLLTSLIVALMMIPALCSKYLKGGSFSASGETKEGIYSSFLRWTLRHRFISIGIAVAITVASLPLFMSIKQEFIPQAAESQFIIKLRMPTGTKLETTEMASQAVEGWLLQDLGENVESVFTRIGPKPENTGVVEEDPEGPHTAELMISLKDDSELDVPKIIEYIEPKAKTIHGLDMTYLMSQTSLSSLLGGDKSALVVEIKGRSLDTLAEIAKSVKQQMDELPEVANVRTSILEGNPEVHLIPDRTLLSEAQLDQQQLINLVQSQLRGTVATSLQDSDQTKAIRVQFKEEKLNLPELLDTLIPLGQDRVVSLKDLVEVKIETGPREIVRRNQERIARVLADVGDGHILSDAVSAVQGQIGAMQLPSGYTLRYGGEEARRQESFERLTFALVLALVLVYMVMASLFESLLHPFVIMFSLPLAALGVIWAFVLTGQTLNLMGYIGIIMLAGIVVNNAIVLVDYINYLRREEKVNVIEAIVSAGVRRLRPIMMTTLTTVLALLPLALGFGEGAEIRAPMAVAVIGGLLSSTVLTLVIIPIVYSIFDDVTNFFVWIFTKIGLLKKQELQQQES